MDQFILTVDSIILGFVQGSFGSLTGIIQTLWRLMFIIFIAIYGYKVMISGNFRSGDLLTHILKIILIWALATQWDTFFIVVYDLVTDFPSDVAGQLMLSATNTLGADLTISDQGTANQALSQFFDRAMLVSSRILEGAGWNNFGLYLYAGAVAIGAVLLTAYAAMLIILAKLAIAILLAIGPIFILLLIFANTRSLFEGWLRTLLSYAVIPIIVYGLLAILLVLAEAPLNELESNSSIDNEMLTVVMPFLLVCVVATILLGQAMNIAASLTGGLSLSTMGFARATPNMVARGTRSSIEGSKGAVRASRRGVQLSKTAYHNTKKSGTSLMNALKKGRLGKQNVT